jgi:hypothetical protein
MNIRQDTFNVIANTVVVLGLAAFMTMTMFLLHVPDFFVGLIIGIWGTSAWFDLNMKYLEHA